MRSKLTKTTYLLSAVFVVSSLLFTDLTLAKSHKKHHHTSHHASKSHLHHIAKAHGHKTKIKLAAADTTKVSLPVSKEPESDTAMNVNPHVWDLATKAFHKATQKGYIKQKVMTIIDYSMPSSKKRMWVVDMYSKKVLYHTLVAHGKHTGGLFATRFSDSPGSRASSLGLFVTENTYIGSKGYSLRLRGLEPGFNDTAHSRAIVVHGAWYATATFAAQHGRLGLSWGCPAVSPRLARPIINDIKGGTLVFAYYPDDHWLKRSEFLL